MYIHHTHILGMLRVSVSDLIRVSSLRCENKEYLAYEFYFISIKSLNFLVAT